MSKKTNDTQAILAIEVSKQILEAFEGEIFQGLLLCVKGDEVHANETSQAL
ncbi:hypothetical protein LB941_07305 [Ligilactobacillus sp. WILCCON 0076]|uniref:Uncharacterized protein n=1 Tax=Ligilactobacillus ubinensis TaxID=2876789 RepID=A0A9X2FKU9_9LACO|nr:hypothetical protein [Ligilactobacillus ubinensis]MCP0887140.1 hypothetical protein [Ligilactobacillus ubinensis]